MKKLSVAQRHELEQVLYHLTDGLDSLKKEHVKICWVQKMGGNNSSFYSKKGEIIHEIDKDSALVRITKSLRILEDFLQL